MSSGDANAAAGPSMPRPDSTSQSGSAASANATAKSAAPPRPVPTFLQPLQFVGVPKSVLTWQPRLPSRNWCIFIGVTTTLTSLYVYDRRECKRISEEYKSQVRHLAQEPVAPQSYPRKLIVYASKSPGDDDAGKSMLFFKMYVKPVLVAAAIDWEILNGVHYGGLARVLKEKHYARRRQLLGLEPWGTPHSGSAATEPDPLVQNILPFSLSPQQQLERELEGGIVIVGRPAYKEWAWALKQGWTTRLPSARQDLDDELAQVLSEDGAFDETPAEGQESSEFAPQSTQEDDGAEPDGAGAPLPSRLSPPGKNVMSFNPAFQQQSRAHSAPRPKQDGAATAPAVDAKLLDPPEHIPAQPPLCFVDYVNLTGFSNIPRRMIGFFNHRQRVRLGGQAALEIALGSKSDARDYEVVLDDETGDVARQEPPQGGDLDWGLGSDYFVPKRFQKMPAQIEKERKSFYENLPRRLRDTRTYVRGERELTATEKGSPPKSESDLRQERFNREREWRNDLMGYEILRSEAGVAWHRAFLGSLRVFAPRESKPVVSAEDPDKDTSQQ